MGVDGFRFDLAPILGNTLDHQRADRQGFHYDKMPADNPLNRAARAGFLFPLVSIGVPMFCGGDELYRTIGGEDNPYNLDDRPNYLDWSGMTTHRSHFDFCRRALAFRRAHPALRPAEYFDGKDHNGNGLKDVTWYRDDATEPDKGY